MYAIAAAVIGGTSLAGGIGTIWGTIIGVFIMSVLATGLPSLNLEAHWQTFFTGVIVIGAVLLDMYRTRKAAEVRIETPADLYKSSMTEKIAAMRRELSTGKSGGNGRGKGGEGPDRAARSELRANFAQMKAHERTQQARLQAEERAADHAFEKEGFRARKTRSVGPSHENIPEHMFGASQREVLMSISVRRGGASGDGGVAFRLPGQVSRRAEGRRSGAGSYCSAGKIYIPIICKGFQHQFWQTVKKGAEAAAAQYGVDITFEGPPTEADIQPQVQMLMNDMAKNPSAICLAALDTNSVMDQLNQALRSTYPSSGSTLESRTRQRALSTRRPPPTATQRRTGRGQDVPRDQGQDRGGKRRTRSRSLTSTRMPQASRDDAERASATR